MSRTHGGLLARSFFLGLTVMALTAGGCTRRHSLERELRSKDPDVRAKAARRLATERPKGAVKRLIRLLDDRGVRVRVEAANGLGRLKANRAASPLSALLRDPDSRVRLAAVKALGRLEKRVASDPLLGAVEDVDRQVRRTARFALQDFGIDRAEQQRLLVLRRLYKLRRQLDNRLPERRLAAVKALGRSGRARVIPDLEKQVLDRYVTVSEEAVRALGMIGGPRSVAFLERLGTQGPHLKALARQGYRALLEARHPAAAPNALRLRFHGDPDLRLAAYEYLLDPPRGVTTRTASVLCPVLGEPDARRAVAWAMRLKAAGVQCPTTSEKGGDLLAANLTHGGVLSPVTAAWVKRQLRAPAKAKPNDLAMALALAANRGGPASQELALSLVKRSYRAMLTASERWMDEAKWRRLAKLPRSGGVVIVPRGRPGAAVGTTPREKQRRQLRHLLDRFPDRLTGELTELMPPHKPSAVGWQVMILAGAKRAWPWIAELAQRSPEQLRVHALRAIGVGQCRRVFCREALIAGLDAASPPVRRAATGALVKLPGLLVSGLLLRLRDADVGVRRRAADALSRSKDPRVYDALLASFRKSREAHLVEAFGRLADPRAERLLNGLLREEHTPLQSGDRLLVIEALERIGTKQSVERLLRDLDHPEPALRLATAKALARIGDRRALDPLAVCAQDFYRAVREACRDARSEIQRKTRR